MPPTLITLYNSINFPESIAIRHRDPSQLINVPFTTSRRLARTVGTKD
jgi:hypothetical protein